MRLDVGLTGAVSVRSGSSVVGERELGGRRARLALAMLVLERDRPLSREELADALWPDDLPPTWASALRGVRSQVRAALTSVLPGIDVLPARQHAQLVVPDDVELKVDVESARDAVLEAEVALAESDHATAAELAARARPILTHPFLPGDEGPWVAEQRAVLRDLLLRALETLAAARIGLEAPALAAAAAAEAVELDPFRESAHRLLMRAHAAAGNRGEALRAYERCRRRLADELGVAPSADTETLYLDLLGSEEAAARPVTLPGELALVGRDGMLQTFEHMVRGLGEGRGTVAILEGEAGIGKSRLLREVAERARRSDVRVVWATCREPEWAPPYGPIVEMLPGLAPLGPPALVERLERRIGLAGSPVGHEERFAAREDLRRLLLAAAADGPILVVIDDLHWADDATIAAVRHAAPVVAEAPLLLVFSLRDDEPAMPAATSNCIAAITRDPGATRLMLSGLDPSAVAELVRATLPDAPAALARVLHDESAGNPFFLQALLLHRLEAGDGIPVAVRDVVERRVARLGSHARALLRAGSLFEDTLNLSVVAAVAGLDEWQSLDAADECLAAHLLAPTRSPDAYRFPHAIVRHALAEAVPPSRRVRMHRRAAEVIEERSGGMPSVRDCYELAGQFHHSASLPGGERGAEYALRAAADAEATGAFDTAAHHVGMAVDMVRRDSPECARLIARQGVLLIQAARYEEGADLVMQGARAVQADEGGRAAAEILADGAWTAELAGSSATAFHLAAVGIDLVDAEPIDDVWARLYILDLRRREADEPRGLGIPIDTPERRLAGRHLYPRYRHDLAWGVWDHRREVLEGGTDDAYALTLWGGCYREALPLWQRRATSSEAHGLVAEAVNAWAGAARCSVALGYLADADRMTEHARTLAHRVELKGSFALHLLGARDDLMHARGEGFDDVWEWSALLTTQRTDRTQRWAEAAFFASAGRILALEGRPDDAVAMLDSVVEVLAAVPAWVAAVNRLIADAVAIAWFTDSAVFVDELEAITREKLLGPDFRCPMVDARLAMARLAGMRGDLDAAAGWFADARRVFDEDGLRPLRVICDLDHATLLSRAGDAEGARVLAEAAAEGADTVGMVGWLRRAERLAIAI